MLISDQTNEKRTEQHFTGDFLFLLLNRADLSLCLAGRDCDAQIFETVHFAVWPRVLCSISMSVPIPRKCTFFFCFLFFGDMMFRFGGEFDFDASIHVLSSVRRIFLWPVAGFLTFTGGGGAERRRLLSGFFL